MDISKSSQIVSPIFLCLLSLTLISCGGGDGKNSESSLVWELPINPGQAGNSTLSGVDSNNNNLRDDVEIRIYDFTNNDTERSSMMVAAREISKALTELNVSMTSDEVDASISRGISCLLTANLDVRDLAYIEALIANTPEREAAYRAYNETRRGTIGSTAEFDNKSECLSFIPK